MDVIVVADGEAAIKAFDAHDFKLVLLDIRMPVVNGIRVLKHIREV